MRHSVTDISSLSTSIWLRSATCQPRLQRHCIVDAAESGLVLCAPRQRERLPCAADLQREIRGFTVDLPRRVEVFHFSIDRPEGYQIVDSEPNRVNLLGQGGAPRRLFERDAEPTGSGLHSRRDHERYAQVPDVTDLL